MGEAPVVKREMGKIRWWFSFRSGQTHGAMREGIAQKHCAVVFNPMSHVGTSARHSDLWGAF